MHTRLSQNFLTNNNIARKIVEAAELTKEDVVLEIGPGRGVLTKLLCEKAGKVIAIEKDIQLAKCLAEMHASNLQIINADALMIEWPNFNKIVANLPYAISTPLTFKMFEYSWERAILMYQKEFADRMTAKPGVKDYSRLSITASYKNDIKKLFSVSKDNFKPSPKVDSTVLQITPKKPDFEANDAFWQTVDLLFKQKKKTLRACLKVNKVPKDKIETINDVLLKKRVFYLTINDIREITNIIN